jgi:hypothetical protein
MHVLLRVAQLVVRQVGSQRLPCIAFPCKNIYLSVSYPLQETFMSLIDILKLALHWLENLGNIGAKLCGQCCQNVL